MTNKHNIIWLDKADSTNSEARRRIDTIDNLSVLSALNQTDGRGQRGNSWKSAPGENLTFSIVMKFGDLRSRIQAYDQFSISQTASLAVLDFLSQHGIEARIKWPNDIYIEGRKICGMLIENSISGEWLSWSIVGIGINVNQTIFPDGVPNPTSMALLTGEKYDVKSLLEEFMEIFDSYRNRYLHINGGLGKLRKLYHAQMWRKDQECTFIDYTRTADGHLNSPMNIISDGHEKDLPTFRGKARGVSDTGQLVVEADDGTVREFGFKEIGWVI